MPLEDHSRFAFKLPQLGAHLPVEVPNLSSIRYLRTWAIGSERFGNLVRFEIECETFLNVKYVGIGQGLDARKELSMNRYHRGSL
jgi:hypothetical protein